MALPSDGRLAGMPALGTGCLGLGLRNSMSSIVFLVLGRKGRSTCDDVGRGTGVVASVSIGGTDSLLVVVVGCFEAASVLGLSTLVTRECWDISGNEVDREVGGRGGFIHERHMTNLTTQTFLPHFITS